MKKQLLSILIILSGVFYNNAFAQLSQGGKPISFEKHFNLTTTIKFESMPVVEKLAEIGPLVEIDSRIDPKEAAQNIKNELEKLIK